MHHSDTEHLLGVRAECEVQGSRRGDACVGPGPNWGQTGAKALLHDSHTTL